jgi:5'-nucleotidase (lipoprotein e(P4) family)
MNAIRLILLTGLVISFSDCTNSSTKVLHQSTSRSVTSLDYSLNSVLWQQRSGEYRALCYQAFTLAKLQMHEMIRQKPASSKTLAVITDIDESVLDNSPQQAHDLLHHQLYTPESWKKWTDLASAKALPGAVEFFQFAHQNGVQVFYISNRNANELESTIRNLKQAGFPQADAQHVVMKGASADKEPRRLEVAEKHQIAMLVGDNLNDFDKLFYQQDAAKRSALVDANRQQFGTRFIVLPNTIYGDWESAIWNARPVSPKEADKLKHRALESY